MEKTFSYLKSHPERAKYFAEIWRELISLYPQVTAMRSKDQWEQFLREHPGLDLDSELWDYGPLSVSDEIQKIIAVYEREQEEIEADKHPEKKTVKEEKGVGRRRIVGKLVQRGKDKHETPLEDATITVTDIQTGKKVQTLTTGIHGEFVTRPLFLSRYLLVFRHKSLGKLEKKWIVNVRTFQPPLRIAIPQSAIDQKNIASSDTSVIVSPLIQEPEQERGLDQPTEAAEKASEGRTILTEREWRQKDQRDRAQSDTTSQSGIILPSGSRSPLPLAPDNTEAATPPPPVIALSGKGISYSPPDAPEIQEVEQAITRLTNQDPAVRASLFQRRPDYTVEWLKQHQRISRQQWDSFVAAHPEIARAHSSYAPIHQALLRQETQQRSASTGEPHVSPLIIPTRPFSPQAPAREEHTSETIPDSISEESDEIEEGEEEPENDEPSQNNVLAQEGDTPSSPPPSRKEPFIPPPAPSHGGVTTAGQPPAPPPSIRQGSFGIRPSFPRPFGVSGKRLPGMPKGFPGIPRIPGVTGGIPGLPGIPGMSGGAAGRRFGVTVAKTAIRAILSIPHVRIALLIVGAIILFFLILLFVIIAMFDDEGAGTVIVEKETPQTQIQNPQLPASCIANSALCLPPPTQQSGQQGGQAVNGVSTSAVLAESDAAPITEVIRDIFRNSDGSFFDKLTEVAKKIKEAQITYTIRVSYDGQAEDIIVTDPIPDNAMFISASGKFTTVKGKLPEGVKGLEGLAGIDKVTEVRWSVRENQGGGTSPSTPNASACVPAPTSNPDWSDWSCNGFVGTTPVKSGWYKATAFGCGLDGQGPGNCAFYCGTQTIPECKGLSDYQCEQTLKYFAADSDRFGCHSKLQLSNPQNGKAVIVQVIDRGPNCSYGQFGERPNGGPILDMSIWAAQALGIGANYELIHVTKVSDTAKVGPVNATSCSANATGAQASTIGGQPATGVGAPSDTSEPSGSVNFSKYTQAPYYLPSPTGPSDINFSESDMNELNTLGSLVAKYQSYLKTKVKNGDPKYIDPFLSVIWTGAVEGIGGNRFFWNCQDTHKDINRGCVGGYYSGGWQVGYGIQVSQATPHIVEDFEAAYGAGSATNASKVREIGQKVISDSGGKITNPSSFPQVPLTTLTSRAQSGDASAQQAVAILLMDRELGAITLAREIAGDIAGIDNWRATMERWAPYYGQYMQRFSNRAKALADRYNGVAVGDTGSRGGATFAPQEFTITVLPLVSNDLFISSRAKATVIGGSGPGTASVSATSSVGGGQILSWAEKIATNLDRSYWSYFNKMMGDVSNGSYAAHKRRGIGDYVDQLSIDGLYWCTFIVIDAYALTGNTGMTPAGHLAVMNMIPFFKNTSGYKYLDYDRQDHKTILKQVQPGYAFFIMAHRDDEPHTGQEHTGLVKTIEIDENGNGFIETIESNSNEISHRFPIHNWNVQNTFYPLRGFGGR